MTSRSAGAGAGVSPRGCLVAPQHMSTAHVEHRVLQVLKALPCCCLRSGSPPAPLCSVWPQLLGGSPGGDIWSGLVLHSETSGLSSASCRPGCGLPGDTCFTVVSPWAAGEYLLGHLELLIPLRLGAQRAVSHTFYLIPHSCEVFCPFLTCYHRGTAMMSLAMLCCGAMVELLCPV